MSYSSGVPRLWSESIEAHRGQVRGAVCDATAALVFENGLRAVTMAQIAEKAGIGRATLYKYFADVDAIMLAWHARQVSEHLAELERLQSVSSDPMSRLKTVMVGFATIAYETRHGHGGELAKFLHHADHVTTAEHRLRDLVAHLLTEAAQTGAIRADVPPQEGAAYVLRALSTAAELDSEAAIRRLVAITLAGISASQRHG